MSYVRKKKIKGHDYDYLVRSERHGKEVRQIHIQYLGKSGVVPNSTPAKVSEFVYPDDPTHPESKYLYSAHKESQQIIQMDPYQYLKFTGMADFKSSPHFSQDAYDDVKTKLKDGKYIDPPFMELRRIPKDSKDIVDKIEYKTGARWYVIGHEGRHRVLAAKDLGIKQVPTLIFFKDESGHYTEAPITLDWVTVVPQSNTLR